MNCFFRWVSKFSSVYPKFSPETWISSRTVFSCCIWLSCGVRWHSCWRHRGGWTTAIDVSSSTTLTIRMRCGSVSCYQPTPLWASQRDATCVCCWVPAPAALLIDICCKCWRSAANPPATFVDGLGRQTYGQTPDRYIDPASRLWAALIKYYNMHASLLP